MKKIVSMLLSILLILSLTACGDSLEAAQVIQVNTAQDSETYVEGEDYQMRWNAWNSTAGRRFTMSENGYYHYYPYNDGLLRFYDFETETDVIVCNQPNCDHTGYPCSARLAALGTNVDSLQYYDGNLYMIGIDPGITLDVTVYRISPDGATQGKVGTILTMSQGSSVSCAVHRGYVYCVMSQDGSLNKTELKLYRLSLSGDSGPEVIYTFDGAYGAGGFVKAYGNYVYISHQYYTERDGDSYAGKLYRCNIHTGKMELVLDDYGRNYVVDGDCVYYSNASEFLVYDMVSGETRVLGDQGLVHPVIEGDYLYLDNSFYVDNLPDVEGVRNYDQRVITVIDRNTFETVATIPLTMSYSFFIGVCGTQMFAEYDFSVYRYDPATADRQGTWVTMN